MAKSRICSVEDCGKPHEGRGYCTGHLKRFHKYGGPLAGPTHVGAPQKWILDHANYDGDECLKFPFSTEANGYCSIKWNRKKTRPHQVMCLLRHGPKPTPEHEVAHTCGNGNQGCCNPRHLVYKTRMQNQRDRVLHGTQNKGATRKLTPEQVLYIRNCGIRPARLLAEQFGVGLPNIYAILNGKGWSWLKDASHIELQEEHIRDARIAGQRRRRAGTPPKSV